ncbi:hypothetical protein GmHk_14G041210 [Glycine max]|nr:hypothetical protein GmHk_14G041210 [Glycine max]
MNIGALISGQMTSIAQSNSSRLGFPTLITALCRARGVVSDSLTFERLSLVVAPAGSIPSIEQFLERVPQQVEDASSEATIPEPFIVKEETSETRVRQEATATLERSREVTSNPPTSVVDLSSPQHATDPSTPILEIPEDPTTPVLTLNTSSPATLVLHLTDEEDVKTQDTQDQSQEF